MKDGMWVAITLDNLAEVLLLRNEGDAATNYLYATLNHGTPLYSWCEERGQEAGAKECTGDRQHLWTPVAVGRYIRDALVMEDGDTLHLARGSARQWLTNGQTLGVEGIASHFGDVSFALRYDPSLQHISGFLELPPDRIAPRVVVHVRLPGGLKIKTSADLANATVGADGESVEWWNVSGKIAFEIPIQPQE